jgi:hypothetical protein
MKPLQVFIDFVKFLFVVLVSALIIASTIIFLQAAAFGTILVLATSKDILSVLNIIAILGLTFAIGLFTYYPTIDSADETHKKKIRLFGLVSFICTAVFIISILFINIKTLQFPVMSWLQDIIYYIASFFGALTLILFYIAFLYTIFELVKKAYAEGLPLIRKKKA